MSTNTSKINTKDSSKLSGQNRKNIFNKIQKQIQKHPIINTCVSVIIIVSVILGAGFLGYQGINKIQEIAEASSPVITSITPNRGPLAGGETATISGSGFSNQTSPDPSFNLNLPLNRQLNTTAVQSDGKGLIGGPGWVFPSITGNDLGIARVNVNGSLDTSFNTDSNLSGTLVDIAVQPDGKILAVGYLRNTETNLLNNVVRLNSNGSIDTSFNIGIGVDNSQDDGGVWAVAVQEDGKIIIGGDITSFNGTPRKGLVRLNPNGSSRHFF